MQGKLIGIYKYDCENPILSYILPKSGENILAQIELVHKQPR